VDFSPKIYNMRSYGIFKLGQWRSCSSVSNLPFCQVKRFLDVRNARLCIFKLESFGNNGKSLNKWERCYRAWPTSTVHSRLDRPTAHPSIFFSSAAALAHRAEAAAAPGSCQDRCHRGFPHAATLVLASLIFSMCQASKQKSRCLSPFPRALLAVTPRVTKSLTPVC
jgi:hypothetical protein